MDTLFLESLSKGLKLSPQLCEKLAAFFFWFWKMGDAYIKDRMSRTFRHEIYFTESETALMLKLKLEDFQKLRLKGVLTFYPLCIRKKLYFKEKEVLNALKSFGLPQSRSEKLKLSSRRNKNKEEFCA